jgi:hypothetical protein
MWHTQMAGVMLVLLSLAHDAHGMCGEEDVCVAQNPKFHGKGRWRGISRRATRCAKREMKQMRLKSMKSTQSAIDESMEEDVWLGQFWDMREWTRESDGQVFYPYLFAKTLPHDDATGLAHRNQLNTVLTAMQCPSKQAIEGMALSSSGARTRVLEGFAGFSTWTMMGGDQIGHRFPAPYPIESVASAFEMAEVYAMQLLRDVPFAEYGTSPLVQFVVDELNKFPGTTTAPTVNGRITAQTLMRGGTFGASVGPYVSQFLIHPFCTRQAGAYRARAGAIARKLAGIGQVARLTRARVRSACAPPLAVRARVCVPRRVCARAQGTAIRSSCRCSRASRTPTTRSTSRDGSPCRRGRWRRSPTRRWARRTTRTTGACSAAT